MIGERRPAVKYFVLKSAPAQPQTHSNPLTHRPIRISRPLLRQRHHSLHCPPHIPSLQFPHLVEQLQIREIHTPAQQHRVVEARSCENGRVRSLQQRTHLLHQLHPHPGKHAVPRPNSRRTVPGVRPIRRFHLPVDHHPEGTERFLVLPSALQPH